MKLSDLRLVRDLSAQLDAAQLTLTDAENCEGELIPSFATLETARVELLPVPKDIVVSAAKRNVVRLVDRLASLGVSTD